MRRCFFMILMTLKKKTMVIGEILSIVLISFLLLSSANFPVPVSAPLKSYCIVVDAGHGKPDGGAVSKEGIEEEALNLAIALKLRDALAEEGYEVIMTRENHENIADEEQKKSMRETKQSDLENRVKIANESHADFMISIHMNEFSNSHYWGWQTFYRKDSEEGKKLANLVQENLSRKIDRPNKRTILPIEKIKIIDKTTLPVIIVECGFLSNEEDVKLLQTEEYQEKIVLGIVSRN